MTHFFEKLLEQDDPLFATALVKLEQSVQGEGVDVRLIADITHSVHAILRTLGLDLTTSTAIEVYGALRAHVAKVEREELLTKDYLLFRIGEEVVSFNPLDLLDDVRHNRAFKTRTLDHGRRALLDEITHRYSSHPSTHEPTVRNLLGKAPRNEGPREEKEKSMSASYVLAIGDIFTDAFIKLNEEVARIETDENGEKRLSLPLGSKPPYDGVEIVQGVGPAPNAAVSTARLGVKTGLISFLGDDQVGKDAIDYLKGEGVITDLISMQEGLKTSYYYVLRYGAERTILVKNEAFAYTWVDPSEEPEWIYLALMSEASWEFHEGLVRYLKAHPNVKLAFQPGTFHFRWGVEKLADLYRRTHIIVLNREEAVDVTGQSYDSIRGLANALHELGPQKVVITDGPNGSYASYDFKLVTIPNYPDPAPPTDRTGAGDAFASTIVAALALGETMDTALTWAPINSASVVQKLGAQAGLLRRQEVDEFLAKAPDWYKLTEYEG
jgi:sugar/nucleoside kinase (ribokinase family)